MYRKLTVIAIPLSLVILAIILSWWYATRPTVDEIPVKLSSPQSSPIQQRPSATTETGQRIARSATAPGASATPSILNENRMQKTPVPGTESHGATEQEELLPASDITPEAQRQQTILAAFEEASAAYARIREQELPLIDENNQLIVEIDEYVAIMHNEDGRWSATEQQRAKRELIAAGERHNEVMRSIHQHYLDRIRIQQEFEEDYGMTWKEAATLYEQQRED